MSVIQRIRDKGAIIMFGIIALALLAFILQDASFSRGNLFSNTTVVGTVNGVKIQRTDFDGKIAMIEKMYGAQAGTKEQLIGGVWNQEVDRIIMEQEYSKLGITVTPKELSDILFDENTSPLKREFTDQQTGRFKADEARNAFAQIKKSKDADQLEMITQAYIVPTVQQALRTKYNNLLQQSIYVPKWLVEKQQADNNAIAGFSYVTAPYSAIVDSTVKVSDDAIIAYAQKHHKEYDRDEETRVINYVSFSAQPSGADTAATLNTLLGLKADFVAATDVKSFLGRVGSEMPFYDSYFSKGKIQQTNKDSLTRLAVGQTYGPYVDGSNFVIAKMVGVKQWPDSAKVRHILIATSNPQNGQVIKQDTIAKKQIDSVEVAIKGGANFDSLCAKYSDDPGSKAKGGVYDFFPQGQMVGTFNEFAFDKTVGSKGVVKTEYGYHYIEVLGQKNVQPAYKLAYLAKPIVASNETVNAASTAAAQFVASAKSKELFEENAKKQNIPSVSSTDIKANDFTISGIGSNRQLVRWVYEHKLGDISEPFEVTDKYIVAIVSAVNPVGLPSAQTLRPQVENLVRNELKAKQILESKFKGSSLEEIAKNVGTTVAKVDTVLFSNPFIPGLGNETKVLGAAFNAELKGKISEPIVGTSGVYAVKVNSIGAKASVNDAEGIKQQLQQAQRMAIYRSSEALKKASVIKDNRSTFY